MAAAKGGATVGVSWKDSGNSFLFSKDGVRRAKRAKRAKEIEELEKELDVLHELERVIDLTGSIHAVKLA